MPGLDDVQHIVVLMLENRSFDHMCGFLKRRIPALDGLTGTETNPRDPAAPTANLVRVSDDALARAPFDPGHALGDVSQQLYGHLEPAFPDNGTNDGFVANARRYATPPEQGDGIMRCFAPESLPVLSSLMQEFAVCDRWFASLPGPTWPNRVFAHAGTSAGHTDNGFRIYDVPTIFQRLEDAGRTWCVYYHGVPQVLVFPHVAPQYLNPLSTKVRAYEQRFLDDVRRGRLADYVFIEPRYLDTPELDANNNPTGRWIWANDQHPPHDVRYGEHLIADVYEALRQSPLWPGVLLLVLFDEHGGFYDHVFPEKAVPPEVAPPPAGVFRFDRYGLRVPAVVVSPLVERGALDRDANGLPIVRDHTSILATIEKKFGLRPLTDRDAAATSLDTLLKRTSPRVDAADAPLTLPRPALDAVTQPPAPPAPQAAAALPRAAAPPSTQGRAAARSVAAPVASAGPRQDRALNDHQQNVLQLLAYASALEAAKARGHATAGTRTVGESVGYLAAATPAAVAQTAQPAAASRAAKAKAARGARGARPARAGKKTTTSARKKTSRSARKKTGKPKKRSRG